MQNEEGQNMDLYIPRKWHVLVVRRISLYWVNVIGPNFGILRTIGWNTKNEVEKSRRWHWTILPLLHKVQTNSRGKDHKETREDNKMTLTRLK